MLLPNPTAGFTDPLALLAGCHRRIAGFCDTLERLDDHLRKAGGDAAARTAAERIMAYFDRAAPLHHADEEIDLLPLLRLRVETPDARASVAAWARRIAAEHREQGASWARLRPELVALREGRTERLVHAAAFIDMERSHYRFEDADVFPLARRVLQRGDIETLGRAMARRRDVPYTPEPKDARTR
ncbi:hemerythrin domain-containing protein [Acidihalobacter ferrooxydans]|uniref:Hemerythrin-like domain-containing protein n=1 Tax=Acidihalobacter ferrooxydans TaxID=1765967 RepID=A0A1P8UJH6_9GAMM|nr:hemerythrin domain-containing protein [Acidihalobacter ferrooxydans]APZ43989.1 hypothetical protein BW247_13550 [Acidihalobacter ferrooxydans]